MSIIQRIRDNAAWFLFIAIGISLLGFLVQDAFVGKTGKGILGGNNTAVGSVNGKAIEDSDYAKKTKQMEDQYQSMGYPSSDMMRQTARETAWKQIISDNTVPEEVNKLGLAVTPKEVDDMLFGANAMEDFKKQFTNEQGIFDVNAAKNTVAQLRKQNTPNAEYFKNTYLPALVNNRLHEKFISLLANTSYVPKWMLEKLNSDNNSLAAVSYVNVPYRTISDSAVKVSDDDIAAFVNKHAEEYKQEESRAISYVAFDASPSAADTAEVRNNLEGLKKEMLATPASDIIAFLAKNGSQINFLDSYISKTALQVPNKDSIMALPKGAVFGPYADAGNLTLAKKIDEKELPDSVKARHILIATVDQKTGQPILPDSVAKKRIDSIETAINHGARFDSMVVKFSDDLGSKNKGGEYTFANGAMVKEFNDFCFDGKKGDRKVVKTQFGYHFIEIEDQKNFNPSYKIAYLSKKIVTSTTTDEKASGLASQFASESRTAKAFDDNQKKRGYNKLLANNIKPNDMVVNSLGSNRQLVKWIFGAAAGEVSEVYTVENKYVVATVSEINKEGTMSVAKAKPLVEHIVRDQKKAALIKTKIGSANTLEAIATATGQQVMKTDSLAFATPFFPNAGQESKVGGYAFNPAVKGKASAPIAGNGGVYAIRTENVYAKSNNGDAAIDQQRKTMIQNQKSAASQGVIEAALQKASVIKDNRSKIY